MKPSWANLLLILVFLTWGLSFLGPHVVGETSESKRLTLDERSMREAGVSYVGRGILGWVSVAIAVATVYLFFQFSNQYKCLSSEAASSRFLKHLKLYAILPTMGLLFSVTKACLSILGLLGIPNPRLADVLHSDFTNNLAYLFLYAYALCLTFSYIHGLRNTRLPREAENPK